MFVHYTSNTDVLSKILNSGLFINQCKRNLMHLFTNDIDVINRDPQNFGMTCVRNEGVVGSKRHCEKFGYFGIVLKEEWVTKNNFRPVIYIDSSNCSNLKESYKLAINQWTEIKENCDDGFHREALYNKNIASTIGAYLLSNWLSDYEYLEPSKHAYQQEWRHVQAIPLYNNRTTSELLEAIQQPSWSSMLRCVKLTLDDIDYFTTSKEHESQLATWLKNNNINKDIFVKEYSHDTIRPINYLLKIWQKLKI